MTRASSPRARAAATCAALPSTPTTSAAHVDELLGERAVAAAEIEDALAALRCEQLDDGCAEVGDEAGVARVTLGIPALGVVRSVVGHAGVAYPKGSPKVRRSSPHGADVFTAAPAGRGPRRATPSLPAGRRRACGNPHTRIRVRRCSPRALVAERSRRLPPASGDRLVGSARVARPTRIVRSTRSTSGGATSNSRGPPS